MRALEKGCAAVMVPSPCQDVDHQFVGATVTVGSPVADCLVRFRDGRIATPACSCPIWRVHGAEWGRPGAPAAASECCLMRIDGYDQQTETEKEGERECV